MAKRPILLLSERIDIDASVRAFVRDIADKMQFNQKIFCTEEIEETQCNIDPFSEFEREKVGQAIYNEGVGYFDLSRVDEYVEKADVAMLVVEVVNARRLQKLLNRFRELRVPYIFIKEGDKCSIDKISVPVTYLEEEKEKGPFAASFARYAKSELSVYRPKDVGTKAKHNIDSFESLFKKFDIRYEVIDSNRSSEKLELESAKRARERGEGLVIVGASREYGLDDILFGPKEKKVILNSGAAVMLINPRADLYTLCD